MLHLQYQGLNLVSWMVPSAVESPLLAQPRGGIASTISSVSPVMPGGVKLAWVCAQVAVVHKEAGKTCSAGGQPGLFSATRTLV